MERARTLMSRPPVAALLIAFAAWTWLAAALGDGDPGPMSLIALAAAAVFIGAGAVPPRLRPVVPGAVVIAASIILLTDVLGTFSGEADDGLFGYGNAKAQFFALAAFAGALVWTWVTRRATRLVLAAVSTIFAIVPIASDSLSGTGLLAGLGFLALAPRTDTMRRAALGVMLGVFVCFLAGTVTFAVLYPRLDPSLARHRVALWHDAVGLIRSEPLIGIGPGRFPAVSPVADPEVESGATHNGFLQAAAETGVVGGLLLTAAFASALVLARAAPTRSRALGGAVVASLAIHASVDYVLHFPWLVIVTASISGSSLAPGAADDDADR